MKKAIFFFFLISVKSISQIQNPNPPVLEPERYFTLQYDNDLFSGTDRYYTQGIFLKLIDPFIKRSPLSYALIRADKNALNYFGVSLQQNVYTPIDIRHQGIFYGERPYTALLFLSHNLISINAEKKILFETQIDLGIIGPNAKGAEEQKFIHKKTNNLQPLGWEYQLSQDLILNYNFKFEKGFFISKNFELMGSGFARLGTLYADAGFGFQTRLGILNPFFNNLGLEKSTTTRKNKFKIFAVLKAKASTVGYNASLQGGFINRSSIYKLQDKDISRLVGQFSCGIVLLYKRLGLSFTRAYLTREFKSGVEHGWGECAITTSF